MSAPANPVEPGVTSAQKEERAKRLAADRRWAKIQIAGSLLIMLAAMVFNPPVMQHFGWFNGPCLGVCEVPVESRDRVCGPDDTNRLVFVRIPKTASSTLERIMKAMSNRKKFSMVAFEEWEDAVENLPSTYGAAESRLGYLDEDPQRSAQRKLKFFTEVARTVLYPPYQGSNRTAFEGHVFRLDWPLALKLPQPGWAKALPDWLLELVHKPRPTLEDMEDLREITVLRRPQDRLRSMYYYQRTGARNSVWRAELVEQRGNASFSDCLEDPECVEINGLRRRCSLQTEFLCGLGEACARPLGAEALAEAKRAVSGEKDSRMALAGVMERLPLVLRMLEQLLPAYFEGISELPFVPHMKKSGVEKDDLSPRAKEVLKDLCSLDDELYDYVDALLVARAEKCGFDLD